MLGGSTERLLSYFHIRPSAEHRPFNSHQFLLWMFQYPNHYITQPGMAYRFTDISVEPIYRHFVKYRLSASVKVRTDKISVIGYRLWPNIGSEYRLNFGDFTPDISVKHRYIGKF